MDSKVLYGKFLENGFTIGPTGKACIKANDKRDFCAVFKFPSGGRVLAGYVFHTETNLGGTSSGMNAEYDTDEEAINEIKKWIDKRNERAASSSQDTAQATR